METISLIIGDSSDIYEFSSKQVGVLDSSWAGTWVVSETLGGTPVISGDLITNENIYNEDSLVGEEIKITYKIFEPSGDELVEYTTLNENNILTISGSMFLNSIVNDETTNVPVPDKYITFTVKGVFVKYSRTQMVKTDAEGNFEIEIDLSPTIKTPENSFFIFQLMPLQSELLDEKTYYLTVEVTQVDVNNKLIFRKEVLQNKLKMLKQGVK